MAMGPVRRNGPIPAIIDCGRLVLVQEVGAFKGGGGLAKKKTVTEQTPSSG